MTMKLDPTSGSLPEPAEVRQALGELLPVLLARRGDLLAVKDARSGRYEHVNEAMAGFLRRPARDVRGLTDTELFDAPLATALRAADQTALAQGAVLASEHRFEWADARREFAVLRAVVAADAAGRRWLCSLWTDLAGDRQREAQLRNALEQIEQQQRANELLRREVADQSVRDPASGLHRRAHWEDQLRREVDLSTREHREFAIVFIEFDPPSAEVLALGAAGDTGPDRDEPGLGRDRLPRGPGGPREHRPLKSGSFARPRDLPSE